MTKANGIVSLKWLNITFLGLQLRRVFCSLPDVSQNIKHDQFEPLPLKLDECQVGYQEATHEEECVDIVIAIGDDLNSIGCSVSYLDLIYE